MVPTPSAAASSSTAQPPTPKGPKSWTHFVAGGMGGMAGAIVTSPFDVVKTRLQSSLFREVTAVAHAGGGAATLAAKPPGGLLYNFVETGHILRDIYRDESPRALFKGLGPTLVGVVPARSINFFVYGNGKQVLARRFNGGAENSYVHLSAAAIAGVVTSACTNPIWVVKTRLQLASHSRDRARGVGGSAAMVRTIAREGGVRAFYKGLSASILGVAEGVIQWTLYERLKRIVAAADGGAPGGPLAWASTAGAAGAAKCVASLITYPHEVLRTRLRQPDVGGARKYTGLVQTLRTVLAEEGARSLYGGLSAHLMRVIPNAAVMFFIYESVLRMES